MSLFAFCWGNHCTLDIEPVFGHFCHPKNSIQLSLFSLELRLIFAHFEVLLLLWLSGHKLINMISDQWFAAVVWS